MSRIAPARRTRDSRPAPRGVLCADRFRPFSTQDEELLVGAAAVVISGVLGMIAGLLAGGLFAAGAITPPRQANIGTDALRVLGVVMILLAAAYVVACAFSRGRQWQVRGRRLKLPSAQLALVQLTLSTANWALMGCAMYLLLGRQVPYATTLSVLLAASIVGVITPIPAGLGVLEAVYLAGERNGAKELVLAVSDLQAARQLRAQGRR